MKNLNEIGKHISYLLRHNPETLTMDKHGYVSVDSLLNYLNISKEDLDTVVNTNNKKRFSYTSDGKKIRASQGHTIEGLDITMRIVTPPDVLYHGTSHTNYLKILESGHIDKIQRQYVHLTDNKHTAYNVGKRYSKNESPDILLINTQMMFNDGFEFRISDNDVYQVDNVPIKYIKVILHK